MDWPNGQERRAWLDRQNERVGNALSYYLGPAAEPVNALAQAAAWLSPGADMMDAAGASRDLMASDSPRNALANAGWLGASLAGMALPGSVGVLRGADDAAETGIRAYHGSPHDFSAFSDDAIGTGEGAQVYGYGHYLAEKEGVSRWYRDALSKKVAPHFEIGGNRLTQKNLEEMRKAAPSAVRDLLSNNEMFSALKNGNKEKFSKAIDGRISYLDGQASSFAQRAENYRANPPLASTYSAEDLDERAAIARRHAEQLRAFSGELGWNEARSKGHMYEVNIRSNPDDFLDWDKPLKDQSENVRNALLGPEGVVSGLQRDEHISEYLDPHVNGEFDSLTGGDFHTVLERLAQEGMLPANGPKVDDAMDSGNARRAVAPFLYNEGVSGIRYLDQGSRGAGEGSRNYVVFDPATIEILRKYGLLGGMVGGGAAGMNALADPQAGERY